MLQHPTSASIARVRLLSARSRRRLQYSVLSVTAVRGGRASFAVGSGAAIAAVDGDDDDAEEERR